MVCRRIYVKNEPRTFRSAMHATVMSRPRKTPTQARRPCV